MALDDIVSMEESLIDELRRRFKDHHMTPEMYEDDNLFARFLRARNHNLDAAETMLRNNLNFRKQNQVDKMLTDYTPNKFMTTDYITLNRLGHDLEGSPVTYMHFGALDPKGILKCVQRNDISMYIVYYLEQDMATMKKESIKTGKLVDKCIYIVNFENFSLANATHKQTLEVLGGLVSMYDRNYPERLKTAYAINVSYYFTIFWKVIKQFLSPATVAKVKIYGKTGWQEELLRHISPEVIPSFLGGNRTDPDGNPLCKSIVKFGGPVPASHFTLNQSALLPGGKKLHIQRMCREEVTSQVVYPGSSLEWEFVVKYKDIGFAVLYKGGRGDVEQVVPQQRIEAGSSTESGMFYCEKEGSYIIEFDNTYSWLYSKEIYYTVTVVPPKNTHSDETLKSQTNNMLQEDSILKSV